MLFHIIRPEDFLRSGSRSCVEFQLGPASLLRLWLSCICLLLAESFSFLGGCTWLLSLPLLSWLALPVGLLFQFLIVLHVSSKFRLWSERGTWIWDVPGGSSSDPFEQSEQGVACTVFLQFAGSMNGLLRQFRHSHLFYLRALRSFLHILQVGGSTCEDDACQQFVFVAGDRIWFHTLARFPRHVPR